MWGPLTGIGSSSSMDWTSCADEYGYFCNRLLKMTVHAREHIDPGRATATRRACRGRSSETWCVQLQRAGGDCDLRPARTTKSGCVASYSDSLCKSVELPVSHFASEEITLENAAAGHHLLITLSPNPSETLGNGGV